MTKRKTLRVDAACITAFLKETSTSRPELAELIGTSVTGLHGWISEGTCPKVVAVAIEGLRRRNRALDPSTFVAVVPPTALAGFQAASDAMGIGLTKIT